MSTTEAYHCAAGAVHKPLGAVCDEEVFAVPYVCHVSDARTATIDRRRQRKQDRWNDLTQGFHRQNVTAQATTFTCCPDGRLTLVTLATPTFVVLRHVLIGGMTNYRIGTHPNASERICPEFDHIDLAKVGQGHETTVSLYEYWVNDSFDHKPKKVSGYLTA